MSGCVRRLLPLVALLPASLASPARADSPAVDTKRFPKLVHLLLVPEEEALLLELKDDKDRRELQKIFWARRDPTPGTPDNEFETNVRAVWKHADDLFSYPNQKGSETGCGQVLALLGRPEEIRGKGDVPRQPSVTVVGDRKRARPRPPPARAARSTTWPTCARARPASRRPGSIATGPACPTTSRAPS